MQNQHFTSLNTSIEKKIKNSIVREYLADYLKNLSRYFGVQLSEEEAIYITAQLSVFRKMSLFTMITPIRYLHLTLQSNLLHI